MTPEGIARVDAERKAAQDGLKMSSLSNAKSIWVGRPPPSKTCTTAPHMTS
jgi:hypothetical protein